MWGSEELKKSLTWPVVLVVEVEMFLLKPNPYIIRWS